MRKLLSMTLLCCVACQDEMDSAPRQGLLELSTPPLLVTAPPHDCSVEGARCEAQGALCPIAGVCRSGACVPGGFGPLPTHTAFAGGSALGPVREDGALYTKPDSLPSRLSAPGVREETAGGPVRLVSGGIGIGGEGLLTATDLTTNTLRWSIELPQRVYRWSGRETDNGRGLVAVATESGEGTEATGTLSFVRITDGVVVRSHPYEGTARGLSSDENGRVFLRTNGSVCRISAFDADGNATWKSAGACGYSELPTLGGRLFDGPSVRDTQTGHELQLLASGRTVQLATDEVLVAAGWGWGNSFEIYDSATLVRRRVVVGGGRPFALTSRGTVLTEVREETYAGLSCASDCTEETGELREYSLEGELIGVCDAVPSWGPAVLSGGLLWIGTGDVGYRAHPVPGYDLAAKGWVTALGTPGAQRRPR